PHSFTSMLTSSPARPLATAPETGNVRDPCTSRTFVVIVIVGGADAAGAATASVAAPASKPHLMGEPSPPRPSGVSRPRAGRGPPARGGAGPPALRTARAAAMPDLTLKRGRCC